MMEKLKNYILETRIMTKEIIPKYLAFCEKMDFGTGVEESLVNRLVDNFPTVQMNPDFASLSSQMQVLIARKRLWLLLRNFDEKNRKMLLNEEGYGLLSIFADQTTFNFEYNDEEKRYIEKWEDRWE